jgi:RimJ/RimL family protein N-acetyltransferase
MAEPPPWIAALRRTPLRTRRLVIRPPRRGDDRHIFPAIEESIEQLAFWLPWAAPGYDRAECARFVTRAAADFAAGRDFALLMFTRAGDFVGGTGLSPRLGHNTRFYEIGYWCRTGLAGRGYATEAVKALIRYALRPGRTHRIEIRCDPRNAASLRVIRKAGLRAEGRLRKVTRDAQGRLVDSLVHAVVR